MPQDIIPFCDSFESLGRTVNDPVPVTLSPELIGLLSNQLYRTPFKAIEELVINAFDAEADEVRIFVADTGNDAQLIREAEFIAVYDDGIGMTYEGIADLWKVGRPKRRDDTLFDRKQRKQIGKFGIGKLSTYTIANRVTYITKAVHDTKAMHEQHLGVTIDYHKFTSKDNTNTTEVKLEVREIDGIDKLWSNDVFRAAVEKVGLSEASLAERSQWTIVILEELKDKARAMKLGRLRWILRTAMPMSERFKLFLNGDAVKSSKEDLTTLVKFDICDLPDERLGALRAKTGYEWRAEDGKLMAEQFPSGISGEVQVTQKTLNKGKSSDLGRSEGFFVYVRGRLINEDDVRFGLHELSHATLNRFRAVIRADDLDAIIKANRESIDDVPLYRHTKYVLNEIFNEARQRYEEYNKQQLNQDKKKQEHERRWVPERLSEYPTADALADYSHDKRGSEPDDSWMYLSVDQNTDIDDLTKRLYSPTGTENTYTYRYSAYGREERLVRFDPADATFTINQDHDLVAEYADSPTARRLLHDLVTSEALLEVYLHEANLEPHVIGEILQKRDDLFRGLADTHMFSLSRLSAFISDSASDRHDLEVALVAGARALGFVTKHIGGPGEPDGIARFSDFPADETQKIILEAKSSADVPSAKDIDFASIRTHMSKHGTKRCLLLAPSYPGGDDGNTARAARRDRISCWTVKQFADVVRAAESRHIHARDILDIVHEKFAPQDVAEAVAARLAEPDWEYRDLYRAVVRALRGMHNKLTDSPRSITMIAGAITNMDGFEGIQESDIRQAVSDLASASRDALLLRDNGAVRLNVDYDELERRVEALTEQPGNSRRQGVFATMVEE